MNRRESEVVHLAGEFLADIGQWGKFCQWCDDRGSRPAEIAAAFNQAARDAGYVTDLRAEDCEP